MYLQYGSFSHTVNEAGVSITRRATWTDTGIQRGFIEQWRVEGFIQAADTGALTTAIQQLQNVYSVQPSGGIGLFLDDGTATAHGIFASQTIGGIRCVEGPNFSEWQGGEYTTFRRYSLTIEAEVFNPACLYVAYAEMLTFRGGGPRNIHLETAIGLPQKQRVQNFTVYRATQDGSAIGLANYPPANAPIWPAALMEPNTVITGKSPKRSGPPGAPTYSDFEISWHYEFEDALPLLGAPTFLTV